MNKDKVWLKSMNIMAPTCHQRAERSFKLGNYQMPVCSRCQGVYTGYIIGLFFFFPVLIIFIPLTYIDGFVQLRTSYTSTNFRRFTTGVLSGIGTIQGLMLLIVVIKTVLITFL